MDKRFTLDDFLAAMDQMQRMGPLKSLMKLVPGMQHDGDEDPDEDVKCVRAVIQSMTRAERQEPGTIDASRRTRIARRSGTNPVDVADLINQFNGMSRMMERMAGMSVRERLREIQDFSGE
jgi:signal recognition particle subunit SRP54